MLSYALLIRIYLRILFEVNQKTINVNLIVIQIYDLFVLRAHVIKVFNMQIDYRISYNDIHIQLIMLIMQNTIEKESKNRMLMNKMAIEKKT